MINKNQRPIILRCADIPTALQLPEDTVDRLREVAGLILYSSEQFKKLVTDLGGKIPDYHQERMK